MAFLALEQDWYWAAGALSEASWVCPGGGGEREGGRESQRHTERQRQTLIAGTTSSRVLEHFPESQFPTL